MKVSYKNSFLSDLKTIRDSKTLELIRTKIDELVLAENPGDFRNTKKLKGAKNAYRIKVGNYRIAYFLEDETIVLVRVLNIKDIYRYFPK